MRIKHRTITIWRPEQLSGHYKQYCIKKTQNDSLIYDIALRTYYNTCLTCKSGLSYFVNSTFFYWIVCVETKCDAKQNNCQTPTIRVFGEKITYENT